MSRAKKADKKITFGVGLRKSIVRNLEILKQKRKENLSSLVEELLVKAMEGEKFYKFVISDILYELPVKGDKSVALKSWAQQIPFLDYTDGILMYNEKNLDVAEDTDLYDILEKLYITINAKDGIGITGELLKTAIINMIEGMKIEKCQVVEGSNGNSLFIIPERGSRLKKVIEVKVEDTSVPKIRAEIEKNLE